VPLIGRALQGATWASMMNVQGDFLYK